MVKDVKEPTSYDEAARSKDWRKAIEGKIQALHQNQTWELVPTLKEVQPIFCKWVYKVKTKPDGTIERYKA